MSVPLKPMVVVETIFKDDSQAPPPKNGYSVELIYRSVSNEFEEMASRIGAPKRRSITLHCNSGKSQGNTLFVFGGSRNKSFFNSVNFYGIEQQSWENVDAINPPTERAWQRSAVIPELNSIVIYGGYNGNVQNSDLFEFDIERRVWTQVTLNRPEPRPLGRNDPTVTVRRIGNKTQLIVVGGYHDTFKHLNDMWVYDLASKYWSELSCKNPIEPRSGHCVEYLKEHDTMLLYGGFGNNVCILMLAVHFTL